MGFDILLVGLLVWGIINSIIVDERINSGGFFSVSILILSVICFFGQVYNLHLMIVTADELAFAQEKCEQNQGVKQIYFETVTCKNNAQFELIVPYKAEKQ